MPYVDLKIKRFTDVFTMLVYVILHHFQLMNDILYDLFRRFGASRQV